MQVATKDKVLIVRPSVTLDLNTNARDLRAFNKFKTAKVRCAQCARLICSIFSIIARASASNCWEWLCTHQPGPSLASAVMTQV